MRAVIDGTTYEFDSDVRLIHDRKGDRILFEPMQPAFSLPEPTRPVKPEPTRAVKPKTERVVQDTRKERYVLKRKPITPVDDPVLAERVLAVLREQGATSTRGMTWRIHGLAASKPERVRLHGVLSRLMEEGRVVGRKRSKTAQYEFSLPDDEVTSGIETAA